MRQPVNIIFKKGKCMSWDEEVSREADKYRERISDFGSLIRGNAQLSIIVEAVLTSAGNKSLNAGYSGSHGDDGAGASVEALKAFLSGYSMAKGSGAGKYQTILDQHNQENDPEYQKYLELKKKFEKK
jgi:hypothetical protein